MGFGVWSVKASQNGGDQTTSGVEAQLLVGTTSPDSVPASVYHTPRIGLDAVLGSFTVGGNVGLFVASSSQSTSGGGSSTGGPGLLMWVLEPRVGYLLPLNDTWVFWPRVGIGIFEYSQSSSSGGQSSTTSATGFALDLEPTILWRALPSAGFSATALADVGVGGSYSTTGESNPPSLTSMNFGVTLGAYVPF
jgi:hypothetical protein